MKKSFLAAFVLLFLCACATSWMRGSGTAQIQSVEGTAEIARETDNWEPARLWQKLHAGDRARTGSGKVDFSLGKYGGVLTLMPDSVLEFEQIGPAAEGAQILAVLNLLQGRVVGDTLKLPPNTRIQVKTRTGVHEIP